jgi:CDP-glucose 4,6-dehydratase
LRELGANVTGYSLPPATSPSHYDVANVGDGIHSALADIRDGQKLKDVVAQARPEVVFHLAAQSLVRPSYENPVETYEVNVIGTANLLEAIRACDSVGAVVIVTSDKCYENREWSWGYREADPLGGHDPYSSSKACAEIVTAAYRSSYFRGPHAPRIASARAGNVIGGGDWARDRLLPDLVRALAAGGKPQIRNPRATRPWQFVLDPLYGYMLLAEHLCGEIGLSFAEAWNFGPDDRDVRSVGAIVDRVIALWGDGAAYELDTSAQPHEAQILKLDSSKARSRLGWSSRLDVETAISWTIDWYRTWSEHASDAAAKTRMNIEAYSTLVAAQAEMRAV